MLQEVEVMVKLTVEADLSLSQPQLIKEISRWLNTNGYKNQVDFEIVSVREEGEIYGNN